MGCFGYICKGCGTSIRGDAISGGENCVMIHVRHGKELGRCEGHYDEYGRVIEDKIFRNDEENNINNHKEICKSEFDLKDSYGYLDRFRIYNGEEVSWFEFTEKYTENELIKNNWDIEKCEFFKYLDEENIKTIRSLEQNLEKLPEEIKDNVRQVILISIKDCLTKEYAISEKYWSLPRAKRDTYSGIVAWHSKCYHKATEEEKQDLTPSKSDPNQSWGKIRKKYS